MPEPSAPSLPPAVSRGQMRLSRDRVIKNGGWVFVRGDIARPGGGGDLSLQDLDDIASQLGPADAFLALPEREAYPFPASSGRPSLAELVTDGNIDRIAARAAFAVFEDGVFALDHFGERSRNSRLPVRPGYMVTRAQRIISRAPVQLPALTPVELQERIRSLAAATA